MVVVAAVLARLVARPFSLIGWQPAGVAAAWVGGGWEPRRAHVDGAAAVAAGAAAPPSCDGAGAADSVGIATGRDRPLSKVGR